MLHVASSRTLSIALVVVSCLLPLSSYSASPQRFPQSESQTQLPTYKGYHEWRKSRVDEIETRIKTLRDKMAQNPIRDINSKDPNMQTSKNSLEAGLRQDLQSQLEHELLTLSISRDLSISDYFVGYLTKQNSVDAAIRDVSGRLSAEEVAELMAAFAEHFFQTRPAAVKMAPRADSGQ